MESMDRLMKINMKKLRGKMKSWIALPATTVLDKSVVKPLGAQLA
jgi:hypothetical protein